MSIKDFFEKTGSKIILFVICAACVVLIGVGTVFLVREAQVNSELSELFDGDEVGTLLVYVKGGVVNAGVYEMPAGARIQDAIRMAGGCTDDGDEASLNLAALLEDGQQITVPLKSGEKQEGLVNINTATIYEIMSLPGIGESYAQKIIEYREANGSFGSVSDLKRVEGIGEKKFQSVKDLITV